MEIQGFSLDCETDSFYLESKVMWVVWAKDLNDPTNKIGVYPFQDPLAGNKLKQWASQYEKPIIVWHYGLGFDAFVVQKFLGIQFTVGPDTFNKKPCVFVDSFFLSMFNSPDREGHSIEYFGSILGLDKIDWRAKAIELGLIKANDPRGAEFKQWHPEFGVYCERDVDVNIKVFWYLWKEFCSLYGEWTGEMPAHYRASQKSFFLMSCQEFAGWEFAVDDAKELHVRILQMMKELEDEVEPNLPPRQLKKGEQKEFTMPQKPFKANGEMSAHMLKFIEKHEGKIVEGGVEFFGKVYTIEGGKQLDVQMPMTMGNQDDMKAWFLKNNWQPTLWNWKKGPDGKPLRDPKTKQLIKASPKIQEAGKICPNLEKMEGDLVKKVVKWLSLRNRASVLEGWLQHPRLQVDQRLPSSRTGITPTFRQKHSVITNLPKASEKVLLGKEFRSLFIVKQGNVLVSVDQSGLESRVEGSYTFKYDNGARASLILNGDIHSRNAKLFYPKETEGFDPDAKDFDKDDPRFKPYRDRSKNGAYALAYGCSPPKLASTLGKPEKEATTLYEAFWDGNPSLKALRDNLTKYWETVGKKARIPAIDGRWLTTRKKSALINTLFQACGAIIMDYAICFIDSWLGGIKYDKDWKPYYLYKGKIVRRIGYMHDQLDFESDPEVAEDLKALIEKAYEHAGQYLKINVPLKGDGKIGANLKEVH